MTMDPDQLREAMARETAAADQAAAIMRSECHEQAEAFALAMIAYYDAMEAAGAPREQINHERSHHARKLHADRAGRS